MAESSFGLLVRNTKPVNRQAAVVGFFRGEHFEARFDSDRPKIYRTFRYPPSADTERPAGANDYTGARSGRMQACYYVKTKELSGSRFRDVWVCRCDCGLFEFRSPSRWTRKGITDDACEPCRRKAEMISAGRPDTAGNSKKTMPERLMRWVSQMRGMGFSDDEICAIRRLDITTNGMSSSEIRAAIASEGGRIDG